MLPPFTPTRPATMLFAPTSVADPAASEYLVRPGGSFMPTSAPTTLSWSPLTAPPAQACPTVPLLIATIPPATLSDPTVTLLRDAERAIRALLLNPSPTTQPSQPESCETSFSPAMPPARLFAPAVTGPDAKECQITPPLLPTRPPASRLAMLAPPTAPVANVRAITPSLPPTSPPSLVR